MRLLKATCAAMWKHGLDLDDTTEGNSGPYQLGPLFSFLQGTADVRRAVLEQC